MAATFLTDIGLHNRAAALWAGEVEAARLESASLLQPRSWLDCSFCCINSDLSANVYSVIVDVHRRGLLITQWADDAEGNDIEAWIETFGDPTNPEEQVEFLHIHSKASPRGFARARTLIKAWLFSLASADDVSRML